MKILYACHFQLSLEPQGDLTFPFVAFSLTRIVNCDNLEKRLEDNKTLFLEKSFVPHCWLYHSSQCQGNRQDLIDLCNKTTKGALKELNDSSEPNVQRSLNVMETPWKEAILTHPVDFVVKSKWNGELTSFTNGSCSSSPFCSQFYQGSLQYLVNYMGVLKSAKEGKSNGLKITLRVPQKNPASFGVLNDMEGFIVEFVPPKYISGAKRYLKNFFKTGKMLTFANLCLLKEFIPRDPLLKFDHNLTIPSTSKKIFGII